MKRIGSSGSIAVLLALVASTAWGAPRLAWDPNPVEEGVTAYTVYWGRISRHDPEFRGYVESQDTAATELTLPLPEDLDATYFAAVVARNAAGLSSDYSTEVTIFNSTGVTIAVGDPVAAASSGGGGGGGGCFLRLLSPGNNPH